MIANMFESIEEYILKPKVERTTHIDLSQPCIEIGGKDSSEYRGLLAHTVNTKIPTGSKIVCAHACENHSCSNPKHLYWATAAENLDDARRSGRHKSIWQCTVEKYGLENAKSMQRENARKGGRIGAKKVNDSKQLSNEELKRWREVFDRVDVSTIGWLSRVQKELGCSHTWIRKVAVKYFPELKFYTRTKKRQ